MNILLTNDDGINSIGIKKLENILKTYGNVYVVAPSVEQSGKACSITAFKEVKVHFIDKFHVAVDGTPVDCVEIASSLLDVNFDLVVSGCNNGYNLSNDIMYSGTCGACIQATMANLKAIAFSIKSKDYFDLLDDFVPKTLDFIFKNNLLNEAYFLNVNFPETKDDLGFKLTKVYEPVTEFYYADSVNKEENSYVVYRKLTSNLDFEDSDILATKKGYISITPLSQSLFKEEIFKKLNNKIS